METNADQLPEMESANCQNFFHIRQQKWAYPVGLFSEMEAMYSS